jgi:ornithine cyclodeaminase/alanine dehydrogenase-like protein (mu-crystallin family)
VKDVDNARAVVDDADIVVTATNSKTPVFDGEWVREGQHIVTLNPSDKFFKGQEVDEAVVAKSDVIVVNYLEQIQQDQQPPLSNAVANGVTDWSQVSELGAVLSGSAEGRISDSQISLHDNNVGMGIQFAAIGAQVLKAAEEKGLGRELPLDYFRTFTDSSSL